MNPRYDRIIPYLLAVAACLGSSSAQILFSGNVKVSGNFSVKHADQFAVVFASDIHIGRANTFAPGEPSNNIVYFDSLRPQAIFMSGDISDNSCAADYNYWQNTTNAVSTPIWVLPGNHDACPELCADANGDAGINVCSENYSNYFALVGTNHWVHTIGSLTFIGFDSRQIRSGFNAGFGEILDSEINWVSNQTYAATTKKIVFVTHYDLPDNLGNNIKSNQASMFNLISNAQLAGIEIPLYLHGHRHTWGDHFTNAATGPTVYVNCPGLSYSASSIDPPYSVAGGYFWAGFTNGVASFQLYAADDPTYTKRDTNFTVPY